MERRRNKISELSNLCQDIKSKAFENESTSLSKERERLLKDSQPSNPQKKMTIEETMANQKQALKSKFF